MELSQIFFARQAKLCSCFLADLGIQFKFQGQVALFPTIFEHLKNLSSTTSRVKLPIEILGSWPIMSVFLSLMLRLNSLKAFAKQLVGHCLASLV